jgi:hypothetical protein
MPSVLLLNVLNGNIHERILPTRPSHAHSRRMLQVHPAVSVIARTNAATLPGAHHSEPYLFPLKSSGPA